MTFYVVTLYDKITYKYLRHLQYGWTNILHLLV